MHSVSHDVADFKHPVGSKLVLDVDADALCIRHLYGSIERQRLIEVLIDSESVPRDGNDGTGRNGAIGARREWIVDQGPWKLRIGCYGAVLCDCVCRGESIGLPRIAG